MSTLSDEYIEHERAIMPMMENRHWALTHEFDDAMRGSFFDNVKTKNIKQIEGWIGEDEEIRKTLFWFKDGKFDDPEWQNLERADDATRKLWDKVKAHYEQLVQMAVKSQRLADITLYSHFNPGLLYTGIAPAARDDDYFTGVELRLIGSVPGQTDSITIWPNDDGYEVAFGARKDDGFTGLRICAADFFSIKVLNTLMTKALAKAGVESRVTTTDGQPVELDKRAISKAIRAKQQPEYGGELILHSTKTVATVDEAIETADVMVTRLYEAFGLEREALNIGREVGNFFILRDSNFDEFISGKRVAEMGKKGLVFLTATLVCRRCRRELAAFFEWAKEHPELIFVLVNLNTPLEPFYNRVFFDMGGENFRNEAKGVTPFVVPYVPGEDGMKYGGDYIATGKDEALTPEEEVKAFFAKMFA